jgi:hypothetical protein
MVRLDAFFELRLENDAEQVTESRSGANNRRL